MTADTLLVKIHKPTHYTADGRKLGGCTPGQPCDCPVLEPSKDYTVSGTTLTFAKIPVSDGE